MSCNKLIIVSHIPVLHEILIDKYSGYFASPHDPYEWKSLIQHILLNPADSTKIQKQTKWCPRYLNLDKIVETALAWEKKIHKL